MMHKRELKDIIGIFEVLYVEDDPLVLAKLTKMFQDIFKTVDTAVDGKDAIQKYDYYFKQNRKNYDIVISDINMPKMNGIDLARNIKEINPSQEILIISAHNESETLQRLINIGVSNFIHKPIKSDELLHIIFKLSDSLLKTKQDIHKVNAVMQLNDEFESLLNGYDNLIIASRTDVNGIITYVSQAFEKISGFTKSELIGHNHNIIRHPDMSDEIFKNMWDTILQGNIWKGKIKNKKKNGDFYWTLTTIGPYFDKRGKTIGYNSIREDITAQIRANELHKKVNMLLRHANDGYMLYDKELLIENGYSDQCIALFKDDHLGGKNIADMLFGNDEYKKELFIKGSNSIFTTNDNSKRILYSSLLPMQNELYGQYLDISYKIVNHSNIMVVIKDITQNVKLKNELELKQQYQKMIIQVIANVNYFLELQDDFESFFEKLYINKTSAEISLGDSPQQILREIHTFKGLFYQMQMHYSSDAIHALETTISRHLANPQMDNAIILLGAHEDIRQSFNADLKIINDMLGKDYLSYQRQIIENSRILDKFKYQLQDILKDPVLINFKLQDLITQIELLSYIDIHTTFEKHVALVSYLSKLLDKPVNQLIIDGEEGLKVPPRFKSFFRNLAHIYRNAVDHGVEDINTRIEKGKNQNATITCKYYYENQHLHIKIYDDGAGIDTHRLTQTAINKGIISNDEAKLLSEDEKVNLIFKDNLSTKDKINEISGRGVGMSAIKESYLALGGTLQIENEIGVGLKYHFILPMTKLLSVNEASQNLENTISLMEVLVNRVKLFFVNDLEIEIIDSRYINETNLDNKINTAIDITNANNNVTIVFSYTKNILLKFTQVFFESILANQEEFENSLDEISQEIINTLVGLAIQDFPKHYSGSTLSVPKNISQEELHSMITDNKNQVLAVLIQTNFGNMICKLIKRM